MYLGALEAAKARLARFPEAEVVPASGVDWISSLEPNSLDWAYLDSTHQYEPTLAELNLLADKLAPGGVLAGDDCWPNRDHHHYSVYRAVRDFVRANNFEYLELARGQWAARKSID
jgi:predicted O-methyltransferase YrrM